MGKAFLCKSGGGGGSKSQIIVTANNGAVVTCTNGTITKEAVSTGTATFKGLDYGTWTVAAKYGGATITRVVEITRLEVVYLDMTRAYLYNAGDTFDDVTGGWEATKTYGKLTLYADTMQYHGETTEITNYASTVKPINVTGYKTLHAVMRTTSGEPLYYLAVGKRSGTTVTETRSTYGSGNTFTEITLDISNLSGDLYVMFGNSIASSWAYRTEVSAIWLD